MVGAGGGVVDSVEGMGKLRRHATSLVWAPNHSVSTLRRRGYGRKMPDEVRPFRIEIDDSALIDLRDRLHGTRWPERETVDDWPQGVPLQPLAPPDPATFEELTEDEQAALAVLEHASQW